MPNEHLVLYSGGGGGYILKMKREWMPLREYHISKQRKLSKNISKTDTDEFGIYSILLPMLWGEIVSLQNAPSSNLSLIGSG